MAFFFFYTYGSQFKTKKKPKTKPKAKQNKLVSQTVTLERRLKANCTKI